ncbi:MAG: hypothetical protein AABM43_12160 [Actinomycetota bacterium]
MVAELVERFTGYDFAGAVGVALAVLVMAGVFGGAAYGIYKLVTGDPDTISKDEAKPDRTDCPPFAPGSC